MFSMYSLAYQMNLKQSEATRNIQFDKRGTASLSTHRLTTSLRSYREDLDDRQSCQTQFPGPNHRVYWKSHWTQWLEFFLILKQKITQTKTLSLSLFLLAFPLASAGLARRWSKDRNVTEPKDKKEQLHDELHLPLKKKQRKDEDWKVSSRLRNKLFLLQLCRDISLDSLW